MLGRKSSISSSNTLAMMHGLNSSLKNNQVREWVVFSTSVNLDTQIKKTTNKATLFFTRETGKTFTWWWACQWFKGVKKLEVVFFNSENSPPHIYMYACKHRHAENITASFIISLRYCWKRYYRCYSCWNQPDEEDCPLLMKTCSSPKLSPRKTQYRCEVIVKANVFLRITRSTLLYIRS